VQAWLKSISSHLSVLKQNPAWQPYTTMYIGGGTPSVLPAEVLEDLLRLLAGSWAGTGTGRDSGSGSSQETLQGAEWTIECNPDDLDRSMLDSFTAFGVNRLSVGIQSLEDPVRQAVQRRGSAAEIFVSLARLGRLWKYRWSVDFMYGMPLQTPVGLAHDIRQTIEMGAGHVSLYQLTLEDGTALAQEVLRGNIDLPDPDLSADQYAAAAELLHAAGFQRYEVSNWALPGQSCLHNLRYWRMDDWDALGPAAVSNRRVGRSFLRGQNSTDDEAYVSDPLGSVVGSTISGIDAMFEFLMMALRTAEGFSTTRFHDIFGLDPISVFGDLPTAFPALLDENSGCWQPNNEGLDFLNRILVAALENAELSGISNISELDTAVFIPDCGTDSRTGGLQP
jgi:oxygen-independent coproporphyrinogen-3 oxidase